VEFHRCDFEGMPVQVAEFMQLVRGVPVGEGRRWQERANCLGVDPDLFFPERGASTREAKAVCRSCEVRAECLEYALDHGEKFGIWGGLSERERRRVRRQRALERRRLASA
jgi:WhiB family redox-sensing transcriptional regulator